MSVNFDIVEADSEHVLEQNIIPVDISTKFGLIVVSEGQIGHGVRALLIIHTCEVKGKHIALEKILMHHLVEYWRDISLGESWVGEADNSLKIRPGEDSLLLFNIAKLLVLYEDLST